MSQYINQLNIKTTEIAILEFCHLMNDYSDVIADIVCPIEFLPIMAGAIQNAYDKHVKAMKEQMQENSINKSLS